MFKKVENLKIINTYWSSVRLTRLTITALITTILFSISSLTLAASPPITQQHVSLEGSLEAELSSLLSEDLSAEELAFILEELFFNDDPSSFSHNTAMIWPEDFGIPVSWDSKKHPYPSSWSTAHIKELERWAQEQDKLYGDDIQAAGVLPIHAVIVALVNLARTCRATYCYRLLRNAAVKRDTKSIVELLGFTYLTVNVMNTLSWIRKKLTPVWHDLSTHIERLLGITGDALLSAHCDLQKLRKGYEIDYCRWARPRRKDIPVGYELILEKIFNG